MADMTVLRRPDVEKMTGLARSTIYAKVADGSFPKPVKISQKAVAWWKREIEAYLNGTWGNAYEVPKDEDQGSKTSKPEDVKCGNCIFFNGYEGSKRGECQRFPPRHFDEGGVHAVGCFPVIGRSDWCGEFRSSW